MQRSAIGIGVGLRHPSSVPEGSRHPQIRVAPVRRDYRLRTVAEMPRTGMTPTPPAEDMSAPTAGPLSGTTSPPGPATYGLRGRIADRHRGRANPTRPARRTT